MKNNLTGRALKLLTGLILTGSALLLFAFKKGANESEELIKKLGLSESSAEQFIWSNISRNYLRIPAFRTLKDVATNNRAAVAKDFGKYIMNYVNSEKFNTLYQEMREQAKPKSEPMMSADVVKMQKESLVTAIDMYEKLIKDMQKKDQPEMKKQLDMMKKQLKDLDDPNPELTKWKSEYPEKPTLLIRKSVERFLAATKDVDFGAGLKDKYNKRYFVNPEYEAKPAEWKMCYRAGKEATDAVRAQATQWLTTLK